MPTAILLSHTAGGFFIGADGRSLRDDETIFSDTEQKIFSFEKDGRSCFAFAVTGTVRFTPDIGDDPNDIVFDFNSAIQQAASQLSTADFSDPKIYCARLAKRVNQALESSVAESRKAGRPVTYPSDVDEFPGNKIANLFLCGYFSKEPCQLSFRFSHFSQTLQEPCAVGSVGLGQSQFSGSRIVAERLYSTEDPRFLRYRTKSTDFVEAIENYVAACSSEDGLAVDFEICRKIGGYVHAAQVTPSGFAWLKPPIELNPARD